MTSEAAPLELKDVTSGYGDVAVIRRVGMTFGQPFSYRRCLGMRASAAIRAVARSLASRWSGALRGSSDPIK